MFLRIFSNSCPLILLLVRSHQAEIIIGKRLIQGRSSVTRVRVEARSFDRGRRNDAFIYTATLLRSLDKTLFDMIISAWWLLTSIIFTRQGVKRQQKNLENGQLQNGLGYFVQRIAPLSLSRDTKNRCINPPGWNFPKCLFHKTCT